MSALLETKNFPLKTPRIILHGLLLATQNAPMHVDLWCAISPLNTKMEMTKPLMSVSFAEIFFTIQRWVYFECSLHLVWCCSLSCITLISRARVTADLCSLNEPTTISGTFVVPQAEPQHCGRFPLSFFNSPSWFTFPWVNCKGSDTSHLLAFVHTMVVGFANDPLKQEHSELLKRMALTASAARNFQKLCYSHGLWLDKARCGACLYKEMNAFVRGYNACAFLSMHQFQFTGFAMTSKYHLICHAKLDILNLLENKDAFWIPNPQTYGCEMNEDVVGKMSRLIRRVDARRASSRALELYLTKSKAVHRRFLLKQKKHQTKPSQLKAACVPLGVPGKRFANRCKGWNQRGGKDWKRMLVVGWSVVLCGCLRWS